MALLPFRFEGWSLEVRIAFFTTAPLWQIMKENLSHIINFLIWGTNKQVVFTKFPSLIDSCENRITR